ncbi:MAG: methyl-accepting chemotaxis protein, partial [Methylotenera sp.]|nr:methyl-accepting chemotaxis protein [Methylotenera sp.]
MVAEKNSQIDPWATSADKLMSMTLVVLVAISFFIGYSNGTQFEALAIGVPALIIPLLFVKTMPGSVIARISLAAAFMVFSALFIQQTRGMNEAHFSIFILLAFLLYYRDWKPIFAAALVIAVHHISFNSFQTYDSGFYVFQSGANYKLLLIHALAVVFEAALLIIIANNLRKEANMIGGSPEDVVNIARHLANGNLNQLIDVDARDKSSVKFALKTMSTNMSVIVSHIESMTVEHGKGNLEALIELDQLHGSYKSMAEKINAMLASQAKLVHKITQSVINFSNGDFDQPFDQLPGKLSFINEAIEQLRANVKAIIEDIAEMSKEHEVGNIDASMDVSKYTGAFAKTVMGVNVMVGAHVREKEEVTEVMRALGDGDFDVQIQQYPGKKAEINKNLDRLKG